MSQPTTRRRGTFAASGILAALLFAAACGTQTAADLDTVAPGAITTPEGKSPRALDADARRAAQGQLPSPSPSVDGAQPGVPGKRLPDARP